MNPFVDYAVISNDTDKMVGILRKHRKNGTALKFNNATMAVLSDDGIVVKTVSVRLSTTKAYMDIYRKGNVNYLDIKVDINTSKEIHADYLTSVYDQAYMNSLLIEKE